MTMIKNIFIIIFGIFLALIFIEFLLSLFPQLLPNNILIYKQMVSRDFDLVHKLKPDAKIMLLNGENKSYTMNTLSLGFGGIGFRDDGINSNKILSIALGDSFTLGLGTNISDVWTEVLERDTDLDVVNMGMFAHSTYNELKLLERYGLKLNPKIVFLGLYANDISDNYLIQRNFNFGLLYALHSLAFEYSNIYKLYSIKRGLEFKPNNNHSFCFGNYCDVYQFSMLENDSEENKIGIALTKKHLIEMVNIAKQNNIIFVIILIPSKELVYYDQLGIDESIYKKGYPIYELATFCIENKLSCIDLTKRLVDEVGKNNKIFISNDGHLNEYGNKVVAEEVQNFLIENNLIR